MKQTRDSQRGRVYKAERAVFSWSDTVSANLIEAYARDVYESPKFLDIVERERAATGTRSSTPGPVKLRALRVAFSARRRGACANRSNNRITFGPTARIPWIAIHELAHIAVFQGDLPDPGHGPVFCRVYLALLRAFVRPQVAETLARSFIAHGVRMI